MAKVFIGVDPHKLSATIEVVDDKETVLATGRFDTDKAGYAAMRKHVACYPERVWAVEGSNGAGRPLAQRLLADGEHVVDVPAKLSARARELDTGHNRKTDAHDAHAVAVVAVRTTGLAGAVLRRGARGVADAGRPARRAEQDPGPGSQPAAPAAGRTRSGTGQEEHHHRPGQDHPGDGAPTRRGRQGPAPARRRTDRRAGRGGEEDQGADQGAQGDGPGLRLDPDGAARRRTGRRRPDPGRHRRRRPLHRPQPVRVLDRHRPHRSLLRGDRPAPPLPGREPADEPHDPHRRHHPDPPRHRRAGPTTGASSPPARPGPKRCAA